jgi:hypothetical protein
MTSTTTTTTKSSRVELSSLEDTDNPPTQYKYELEVDYPRSEWAHYVANALVVDKELKPKMITKTITVVNEKTLKVYDFWCSRHLLMKKFEILIIY